MEQKTNEIRKDVGESTAELKTATNSADILVTDKSQRLFHITYNAIQATYAAFCSTVKFRDFSRRNSRVYSEKRTKTRSCEGTREYFQL